jgi:hypothetical protein
MPCALPLALLLLLPLRQLCPSTAAAAVVEVPQGQLASLQVAPAAEN